MILAGLLAALYLFAGMTKLLQPKEKLAKSNMAWVEDFDGSQVKAIGAVEVLGAIGLVLPWALDIAPVLTPIAATGFVLLQAGAIRTHQRRGEKQMLPLNGALLLLAAVVAVLRFAQL
jgi:DoxX-like family